MNTHFKIIPTRLIPASVALWATLGASTLAQTGTAPVMTPTAPTGQAAPADSPVIDPNTYLLAPSDQIDLDLQSQSDMHRSVTVSNNGTINYPVVGTVKAAGLTETQLQDVLDKGLSRRYNQPRVTAVVTLTHTRRVVVSGPVRAPGNYDYRPGLRVLDVLTQSGGVTGTPETTQATLISDGGTRSTPIDLVALISDGDQTQNLVLAPGDELLLSPKDPAKASIHVVGQVNKPGDYGVVNNGATVLAILTEAGGATGAAALSHAQILRHDGGKVQIIDLHPLKYNLDDPAGQIKLAAGDTLLLPENNNKVYALGEVRSNTVLLIPDGETLDVTQALALAGGANDDGDKKQVGILRYVRVNKYVTKRELVEVNIQDYLKNKNSVSDVLLQPGDILIVPTRHHGHSVGEYLGGLSSAAFSVIGLRQL